MNFTSRFSIGQLVDSGGVLYTVAAVKFTHDGKTLYDLIHANGEYIYHVESMDVNPVEGN